MIYRKNLSNIWIYELVGVGGGGVELCKNTSNGLGNTQLFHLTGVFLFLQVQIAHQGCNLHYGKKITSISESLTDDRKSLYRSSITTKPLELPHYHHPA